MYLNENKMDETDTIKVNPIEKLIVLSAELSLVERAGIRVQNTFNLKF